MTNVITTFLALILALNNFIFNYKYIFKLKDMSWKLSAHQVRLTRGLVKGEQKKLKPLVKQSLKAVLLNEKSKTQTKT